MQQLTNEGLDDFWIDRFGGIIPQFPAQSRQEEIDNADVMGMLPANSEEEEIFLLNAFINPNLKSRIEETPERYFFDFAEASLITGSEEQNNGLIWTSLIEGASGNEISVTLDASGTGSPVISVLNKQISITFDGTSVTAADMIEIVGDDESTRELVQVENLDESLGTGLVASLSQTYMIEGRDLDQLFQLTQNGYFERLLNVLDAPIVSAEGEPFTISVDVGNPRFTIPSTRFPSSWRLSKLPNAQERISIEPGRVDHNSVKVDLFDYDESEAFVGIATAILDTVGSETYTFTFWQKGDTSDATGVFRVIWYDENGESTEAAQTFAVGSAWAEETIPLTAPVDAVSCDVEIGLETSAESQEGHVFIDDVSALDSSLVEHIDNGNFQEIEPQHLIDQVGYKETEVVIGDSIGFDPASGYVLRAVGNQSLFEFAEGLQSGVTYYVRARHWDIADRASEWSDEVSVEVKDAQRATTLTVAASDSTQAGKAGADYVCDGTNDEEEINLALAAVGATQGRVTLLEGTYNLQEGVPIEIWSNTSFFGQGAGTILRTDPGSFSTSGVIENKNGNDTNISITDLKLLNVGSEMRAFSFASVTTVYVSNLTITGYGFGRFDDCQNVFAVNNSMLDTHALFLEECQDFHIYGNTCDGGGGAGLRLVECSNGFIYNNIVKNMRASFFTGGISIRSCQDVVVQNNSCIGNGMTTVEDGDGITVQSSWDRPSTERISVIGNICTNNSAHGIMITSVIKDGEPDSRARECIIADNICSDNGVDGIMLRGAYDCQVMNNTCTNNGSAGFSNAGLRAGIELWEFTSGLTPPLTAHTEYCNVQGNVCRKGEYQQYGIHVRDSGQTGNLVTNNDLYNSGIVDEFVDQGTGTTTTAGNRI